MGRSSRPRGKKFLGVFGGFGFGHLIVFLGTRAADAAFQTPEARVCSAPSDQKAMYSFRTRIINAVPGVREPKERSHLAPRSLAGLALLKARRH